LVFILLLNLSTSQKILKIEERLMEDYQEELLEGRAGEFDLPELEEDATEL
jgi:hypothetical protein